VSRPWFHLAFKPKKNPGLPHGHPENSDGPLPCFPYLRSQHRGKKRRDSNASDAAQLSVKAATGHGGPLDVVLWGKKTWISHSLKWENAGHRVSFEKNI